MSEDAARIEYAGNGDPPPSPLTLSPALGTGRDVLVEVQGLIDTGGREL